MGMASDGFTETREEFDFVFDSLQATTKRKDRLLLIGLLEAIVEKATRELEEEQRRLEEMQRKCKELRKK
jgi:hypothetical protein